MLNIKFAKMSGAGNDFVLIDNRTDISEKLSPKIISKICTRRLAVGADGLILLSRSEDTDFTMEYFNADGSRADMCGNGGRCVARFANLLGLGDNNGLVTFKSAGQKYKAVVDKEQVDLGLISPEDFEQNIKISLKSGNEKTLDFMNTGVPHVVLFEEPEDIEALGREIRFHTRFEPQGTNVNFCKIISENELKIRTYERGVEAETLACGTGAAAATLLAALKGLVKSPVSVLTRSGEKLEMKFKLEAGSISEVQQKGRVRVIFWGELDKAAIEF